MMNKYKIIRNCYVLKSKKPKYKTLASIYLFESDLAA